MANCTLDDRPRQKSGPKILIVDDEPKIREFVARVLKEYFPKCQIEEAADGVEAAEKLVLVNPTLVILDIKLPGISGLDVCRIIQEQPMHSKTRVLAITGCPSPALSKEMFNRGASEFLRKPFDIQELAGSINRLL